MLNKLLNLSEIKADNGDRNEFPKIEKVSKRDMAIIGMCGKFPMAENIGEFWENIRNGKDCIREFPYQRMKDVSPILPNSYMPADPPKLCEAGYLDEIDKFDYEFFNISPIEARLMDPNQRLFLETAWNVIEEAGYGGNRIKGTKTGVYVGHSSDLKFEYHMYVNMADTELYKNVSLPGNVKSIIASRISYLLDLKGPSVVVDTACSSALLAIHLACQGIINGECEMAIAGGVKVNLLPIQKGMDDEIGIRSPGDRARTFDDSSDGTGSGEGVVAIMLKPLSKAITDGDNIYAVIKGSAVNQDGSSVGLTAPNSAAQEEVILEAWKNANIDPETISYIEAHGTATKLGDPIEISGIERAFRKHTGKKNFCAVGSVKTNIGHLDNIAGLAGMIKLVLALKHKEIPASIHFKRPNRKINFIDSPVYVNDRLARWETEGAPLRGGVSSFGLAGTNCHIVVEEYKGKERKYMNEPVESLQILALSAQNRDILMALVNKYALYLEKDKDTALEDICHTANTGRIHHSHRLAVVVGTREELKKKLGSFNFEDTSEDNAYYGEYRIVSGSKEIKAKNEISEDAKKELDRAAHQIIESISGVEKKHQSILNEICSLYIKGAEIDWNLMYAMRNVKKVSLPTYPFKRSRCWVEAISKQEAPKLGQAKEIDHPLLDRCIVKTYKQEVYAAKFATDTHWVIGEHKVAGRCVMPGTAYLEMIRRIYSKHLVHSYLELENVLFISPFIAEDGEAKEIQVIVSERDEYCDFTVASGAKSGNGWNVHVEGKVIPVSMNDVPLYDINRIMQDAEMEEIIDDDARKIIVEIGPRWTGIKKKLYAGKNGEYLASFKLPDEFKEDLKEYYLHPPLMDRSINAVNTLIGEGSYLPLSYKNIKIYGPTPDEFYSYLKRKDYEKGGHETARFDILLIDKNGRVFVEVKDYVIKSVREEEFKFRQLKENKDIFHEVHWRPSQLNGNAKNLNDGDILVFKGSNGICDSLVKRLRDEGYSLVEVEIGSEFRKVNEDRYIIKCEENDYRRMLAEIADRRLSRILHLSTISRGGRIENVNQLEEKQNQGVYSLFYLTRALIAKKFNKEIDIVLVSDYANEITKSDSKINPHNAALFGLGKVVTREYPNLKCRCIDIDDVTTVDTIVKELKLGGGTYQAAYRGDTRYIDEFKKYNIAGEHSTKIEIKDKGAYIVTGGIGGLGLEVGKYLASKNRAKIVLISRTKMPEREIWDEVLEVKADVKVCRAIMAIREIEKAGAEVSCYSANVARIDEMKGVIEEIRNKYGSINGIVHCAGVAGDGFIINREEETFKSVTAPKIQGTWILDKLTETDDLDFFILFSSITSVLGGQGQGDYTAANSYLDSFAAYRSKQGKRTTAINWPAWKEVGMAVDYGVDESMNTLKALPTDIAISVLNEVLGKQTHRVIVGELNFEVFSALEAQFPITIADDMQLMINEYDSTIKTNISAKDKKHPQDFVIKGSSDEDVFSETERKIAGIWAELLGLEEVNIYDNFNSLGGDSILATRLLRKLENEYPDMVDIADVFAYSTVNAMAEYIDGMIKKRDFKGDSEEINDNEDLDELLAKLAKGEISVNEAEKYY
ncbi:MAG: SDR family NAD(P)-dependent oxidoreductase [Clostridia bacterium]|nr:SDR family NAD(P)-dependent oxidoreductase [Clostridia bacterium]